MSQLVNIFAVNHYRFCVMKPVLTAAFYAVPFGDKKKY
jgi:hypothetical protein